MHLPLVPPFRQLFVEAKNTTLENFRARQPTRKEVFTPGRFDGRNGFGPDSG
jgi:hypothetical protein